MDCVWHVCDKYFGFLVYIFGILKVSPRIRSSYGNSSFLQGLFAVNSVSSSIV